MEHDKYATEILKTGFVLESKIADALRRGGWSVISNKYYEDDFEGSVREIDLLAYKVKKVQHLDVYTTLLISCKKSDNNIWALLARKINLKDPNSDWWPLHAWSNDKAILYQLSKTGMAKEYHESMIKLGVHEALSIPDSEVFAFQEMNRTSGAPQNDKSIFTSLTSLMKAQAYEHGALSQRKKSPSVYQFNLLSIIDSDLIRLMIDGDNISEASIESEHYISRYIIKKNEIFSRIRFVKAACFEEKLKDYGNLHEANCRWFDRTFNNFYDDIVKDWDRAKLYIDEFKSKIRWGLYSIILHNFKMHLEPKDISLEWQQNKNKLAIVIQLESNVIDFLNQDEGAKKSVADTLKAIYRYTGEFYFSEDLPF